MVRYRGLTGILILACFLAIFLACFAKAMKPGVQFGFRDAGHFYYPLYQRVQQEWRQGRWPPLWEPEENSGMPLLGNPTAAVLYPGKLIYAVLPYPAAARVYIMVHAVLAFAAMLMAARSWGTSWAGSGIAALAYAFGAPVLFQYCNIIYLVGAAWLPLGFMAVDRWLTRGSRWAILGLAGVLAMQMLGGDPQSAYLLGLCSVAYAAGLAWHRARRRDALDAAAAVPAQRSRLWWFLPLVPLGLAAWAVGTVALAAILPVYRPTGNPPPALPWMLHVPRAMLLLWGRSGPLLRAAMARKRLAVAPGAPWCWGFVARQFWRPCFRRRSCFRFSSSPSKRCRAEGEGPHDIYPFSIEPFRLAELVWPNVTGTAFGRDAHWLECAPAAGHSPEGLGAVALPGKPGPDARRRGVLAPPRSGPPRLAVGDRDAQRAGQPGPVHQPDLGRADACPDHRTSRFPRSVRWIPTRSRRSGSIAISATVMAALYWWMSTLMPGFRQFRFPAKLFTFTAFGIAALAGMGWDSLRNERHRGTLWLAGLILLSSLGLLSMLLTHRQAIITALSGGKDVASSFGPLDVQAGYAEMCWGLVHGAW